MIRIRTAMLLVLLLPLVSHAAGLGFLKNSPVYYFNDDDRKLLNDAVIQVLNDDGGTATREWNNPQTGASGKVQSLGKFHTEDGLDCRKLRIWNQAKGLESDTTYPVCRQSGGDWRLASGKQLIPA